jgi:multiple sugar transport system permease protein
MSGSLPPDKGQGRREMAIIDRVGRKKTGVRVFISVMYVLLTLGAITMIYPFLLMVSASVKTEVDKNELGIIPEYLYRDEKLYQKYLHDKYSGTISADAAFPGLNDTYGSDYIIFDEVSLPDRDLSQSHDRRMLEDWQEFREKLPERYKVAGFQTVRGATGRVERSYQRWLARRYKGSIRELSRAYNEENESFQTVALPYELYSTRVWQPHESVRVKDWERFKSNLPEEYKVVESGDGIWQTWLMVRYEKNIALLNKRYQAGFHSFSELHLPPSPPENRVEQSDWVEFMRDRWPLHYLRVTGGKKGYQSYLQAKYGNIATLNKFYDTGYRSFTEIPLLQVGQNDGNRIGNIVLSDWGEFVRVKLSPVYMGADSLENRYREFLKSKYGDISKVNETYGTRYNDWIEIPAPYKESDFADLARAKTSWRLYFLVKNYSTVIDYVLLHGRAVLNTAIFCAAVIVTTLIVNPLCAFALSRFNLKATNKILLFLLATMAFPAEVTMIPNFLLLKEFHMLNTYWALILPGMASGFSIFLLKGFFDSLPRELYEAATLDGASEMRIFCRITVPLAKPVLAYLALGAFTGAYGAFMYAMLVCQNPGMWTIMVWLYEMQLWAPSFVQMAAFVVATIPTLLVFIFAQKVIMRGIILPVEH